MIGKQDPSAALEMVTTPQEYPVWRTRKPIIVPRNEPHTYMYALFEGGKFKKWESLGAPRKLRCTQPLERVHDTFDQPASPSQRRRSLQPQLGDDDSSRLERSDTDVRMSRADTDLGDMQPPQPPPNAKLYLVCFHLPVSLRCDAEGRWHADWNDSLIAKTDNSVANKIETYWVGTITVAGETREFTAQEQKDITELLKPMRCTPLFVPPNIIHGSYLGYCKQILWPVSS
jgi:trehalose 6-phosphate synthase/phosphatase